VTSLTRPEGPATDLGNHDALVVSGGLSGWAAAVTLARAGRDVLLAAERTALGYEVWGALSLWHGERESLPASPLMAEVLRGLSSVNAVQDGALDPVATQILLERAAEEAGVKLLYQVYCHWAETGRVTVTGKWGTMSASAPVLVDATRAGGLALEAGASVAARATDESSLRRALMIRTECNEETELEVGDGLPVIGGRILARPGVWPGDVILEARLDIEAADPSDLEIESRRAMATAAARIRERSPGFGHASLVHVAHDAIVPRDRVIEGAQETLLPAGAPGVVLASPVADLGELTAAACYQACNAVRTGETAAAFAGQLLEG